MINSPYFCSIFFSQLSSILWFCLFVYFICIQPVINSSQLMLIRSTTAPLTFHNGFSQIKETDNSPSNVLTPSRHSFCSFCLQSVNIWWFRWRQAHHEININYLGKFLEGKSNTEVGLWSVYWDFRCDPHRYLNWTELWPLLLRGGKPQNVGTFCLSIHWTSSRGSIWSTQHVYEKNHILLWGENLVLNCLWISFCSV